MSNTYYCTPLRYPGGKRKIASFVQLLLEENGLIGIKYIEPFAGGAGLALSLLFNEYAERVVLNDLCPGVYAFWHSVLHRTDELCTRIEGVRVSVEEWEKQREIQAAGLDAGLLRLGFSTFFLNRTNRSGILSGGVIGGKDQTGKWKIDARFRRAPLIQRIRRVARYRDRIDMSNTDGLDLLDHLERGQQGGSRLYFIDPPYYEKNRGLYFNHYSAEDHSKLAERIRSLRSSWIVSYDNVPDVRSLYEGFACREYDLNYSAGRPSRGQEVLFFSDDLEVPVLSEPSSVHLRKVVAPAGFVTGERRGVAELQR